MRTRLLHIGLIILLLAPHSIGVAQDATSEAELDPEIVELARGLSSEQFLERENSMRGLWERGLKAKGVLERMAEDPDAETRIRAKKILRDFDYGILPNTPVRLRQKIAQFRDGGAEAQSQAFAGLLRERNYEVIENLIMRQANTAFRSTLLMQMFSDPNVAQDHMEIEKIASLVSRVGHDQSEQWRVDAEATVLFSQALMTELARIGRLKRVRDYVAGKDAEGDRPAFLKTFFSSIATIGVLVQNGQLDFAFELLELESQKTQRSELALRMTSNTFVPQALLERGEFISFLDRLEPLVDAEVPQSIVVAAFRSSSTITVMLKNHGFESLMDMTGRVADPAMRGALLGRIMSDRAVITYLRSKDNLTRIVQLATSEKDEATRQSYIRAILQSNVLASLEEAESSDILMSIWQLVEASSDPAVQQHALSRLMHLPAFVRQIRDKDGAKKLFEMLGKLDPKLLEMMISRLTYNPEAIALLSQESTLAATVGLVGKLDPWKREQVLVRLFASNTLFRDLSNEKCKELVLAVAEDLKPAFQCDYIGAILKSSNSKLSSTHVIDALLSRLLTVPPAVQGRAVEAIVGSYRGPRWIDNEEKMQWILDALPQASSETAHQLYMSILTDNRRQSLFFRIGSVDDMLAMVDKLQLDHASTLIGAVTGSAGLFQWLTENDDTMRLVRICRAQSKPELRSSALKGVFGNSPAMRSLIEQGAFDQLIAIIDSEQDPLARARLWSMFMQGWDVITHITKHERTDLLLAFTRDDWSEPERRVFVVGVLKSAAAVRQIIEENQFDAILGLADETTPPGPRGEMLSAILSSPECIGELIRRKALTKTFDDARDLEEAPQGFASILATRADVIAEFARDEQLGTFVSWVDKQLSPSHRQSVLRSMCYSQGSIEQFVKHDAADSLLDVVSDSAADPNLMIYQSLLSRQSSVESLVDAGYLDRMIDIVEGPGALISSRLCNALLTHQCVFDWMAEQDRIDQLLGLIESLDTGVARRNVISRVVARQAAVRTIADAGFLDELFAWVDQEPVAAVQREWLAAITRGVGAEAIINASRVEMLFVMASDPKAGPAMVTSVVSSRESVQAIQRSGHFDQLLELCESSGHREMMLAALIVSEYAVEVLDMEQQVGPWVDELFQSATDSVRQHVVTMARQHSHVRKIAAERGHFSIIVETVQSSTENESTRSTNLVSILCTPQGAHWLETENKTGLLIELLSGSVDDGLRLSLLSQVYSSPEVIRGLARAQGLKVITQMIEGFPASHRDAARGYLLHNSGAALQWILAGRVDQLAESLDGVRSSTVRSVISMMLREPLVAQQFADGKTLPAMHRMLSMISPEHREMYLDRFFRNGNIRWHLIAAGQSETLQQLVDPSPDGNRNIESLLFSPSGEVAQRIFNGQFEQAESLLLEHAEDEIGRSRLAAYYAQRDLLDQRVLEFTEQDNHRALTAYLLRCNGQYEKSANMFRSLQSPHIARNVLSAAGNWKQAAAEHRRLGESTQLGNESSHLAMQVSLDRLAGSGDALARGVTKLKAIAAKSTNQAVKLQCAVALILNDQFDEAERLFKDADPQIYFQWLCIQNRFEPALQAIGFDQTRIDAWIDQHLGAQRNLAEGVPLGILVADQLVRMGRYDSAKAIHEAMQVVVSRLPVTSSSRAKRYALARSLKYAGDMESALEVSILNNRSTASLNDTMRYLYPEVWNNRQHEVSAWWQHCMRNAQRFFGSPSGRPAENRDTIRILSAVFAGTPVELASGSLPAKEFVLSEIDQAQRLGTRYWIRPMVATLVALGDAESAIQLLDVSPGPYPQPYPTKGLAYRAAEDWSAAAESFLELWQGSRDNLEYLYLSGDSLRRSGEQQRGDERILQASMMAIQPERRLQLAQRLDQLQAVELAENEYRLLLKTSPLESHYWREAMYWLAEHTDVAGGRTELQQQRLLSELQKSVTPQSVGNLMGLKLELYRLQATKAVKAGDLPAANRWVEMALTANDADISLSETLIPELHEHGHHEIADRLFDTQHRKLRKLCDEYYGSAHLRNNHAWLCAQAERQLDEALADASEAVRVRPDSTMFLDTLAEVYFRRGETGMAIDRMTEALTLKPLDTYLQDQLRRFRGRLESQGQDDGNDD